MKALSFPVLASLVLASALPAGCGHARRVVLNLQTKIQPKDLFRQACAPARQIRVTKGSAQMKVKSREASGQFSALVEARVPAELKLEVLKPFGGTYAVLKINGADYTIDVPRHPERNRSGSGNWAGIPLVWATELFLGRIPCPAPEDADRSRIVINSDDELLVDVPATQGKRSREEQHFIYRFRQEGTGYWPESLHWEAGKSTVDFRFDDPDAETLSPRSWEATSGESEAKLHWTDRQMLR